MERTLTDKGAATRRRIIEGAVAEVRTKGAAAATLDDIRLATKTSKSQLFHYFPEGKVQLLRAVAEHEADLVLAEQQPYLDNLTSWQNWQDWRDTVVARYRKQGQHCPLSTLMNQLGRTDPASRAIVVSLLRRWQQKLTDGIHSMQSQGLVSSTIDSDRSAAALLAGLQGGVVVLLATGSITHLEIAIDTAISHLHEPVEESGSGRLRSPGARQSQY
jgi:AcrR family transcriptional regulator